MPKNAKTPDFRKMQPSIRDVSEVSQNQESFKSDSVLDRILAVVLT
jgi:hypothetical protein